MIYNSNIYENLAVHDKTKREIFESMLCFILLRVWRLLHEGLSDVSSYKSSEEVICDKKKACR